MADDLLVLAAKIRSRLGGADLSTDFLYDPETGLPA
jgi:antitoxin VapB